VEPSNKIDQVRENFGNRSNAMSPTLRIGVCQLILHLKMDNRLYINRTGRCKEENSSLGESSSGEYEGVFIDWVSLSRGRCGN
jgi:hypothetical protein